MISIITLLTALLTCFLAVILAGTVSAIEAFPVAGFLYAILTNVFSIVVFPYWTWYLIAWGVLFIFNLLFKTQTNSKAIKE